MLFLDGVNEVSLGLEDQVDIRINRDKDIRTPHFDWLPLCGCLYKDPQLINYFVF